MATNASQDNTTKPLHRIDKPQSQTSSPDLAAVIGEAGSIQYQSGAAKKPRGADGDKFTPATKNSQYSIFNDFNVISLHKGNYPITDEQTKNKRDEYFNPSSAIDLIQRPVGASIFSPRDFILCARYGLPINRMITLRRFPYPAPDNIFEIDNTQIDGRAAASEPDIGRLVTYMDQETNKISDVCKFSFNMKWKELNATTEDAAQDLQGDREGVSKFMRSFSALIDNGTLSQNAVQGEHRLQVNPVADQNKVYGPVDSIARTYIRDIGLENEMKFSIVFDYELRSINGMNPKMMFIDLLSNILAVTFNNGRFWGGARFWVGGRPSNMMRKLAFMNPRNAEEFMRGASIAVKEAVKELSTPQGALETLKRIASNGLNLALGKILDKLGRPSIVTMNSLLTSEPVGDWHLTIGNPLNPIMSIGNLRLTNTEIEFGDRLGFDDFPTTIKVTCDLEPGQPRDRAGIEMIFNKGYNRTYWTPTSLLKRSYSELKVASGTGTQKSGSSINMFGEFDDSAVIRAAEQQGEFMRDDPNSSYQIGLTSSQVASTTTKPPEQTWESMMDANATEASLPKVDTDSSPAVSTNVYE